MVQVGQFYQGSGLLQPVSDLVRLPIDQVNFLFCNLVAFLAGHQFRKHLSPGTYSSTQRHLVEVSLGLALAFFCFGYQAIHLVLYPTISYLLVLYGPRKSYHVMVFVAAILYLCIMHIYRLYYDFGGFSLDVTGPMMIMTQKVTIIAYCVHDGEVPEEKLSDDQKSLVIKKIPDPLRYYSYMFYFHGLMCGPLAFYADYIKFIDGDSYKIPHPSSKTENGTGEEKYIEPNPNKAIWDNAIITAVNGILMLLHPVVMPTSFMAEPEFLYSRSYLYRNIYMILSVSFTRCKYYFAWKLGEITNQAAGLGFHGYDKDGNEKWDMLNNIDIYNLETSNSMKVNIDSWNKGTQLWLRRVVYDRLPPAINTFGVFIITAFWHGFYPGYYFTFISAAIVTMAARHARRRFRPFFQTSPQKAYFWDCVTFIATRIANPYLASTFCLLEFRAGVTLVWSLGAYLHIISIAMLVYINIVPLKRPKPKAE